jgi:hypothetical protein
MGLKAREDKTILLTLVQSVQCLGRLGFDHRLNMEVDLQSLFVLKSRDVHSCAHWLIPLNPLYPSPALGLVYEGAIGQRR